MCVEFLCHGPPHRAPAAQASATVLGLRILSIFARFYPRIRPRRKFVGGCHLLCTGARGWEERDGERGSERENQSFLLTRQDKEGHSI